MVTSHGRERALETGARLQPLPRMSETVSPIRGADASLQSGTTGTAREPGLNDFEAPEAGGRVRLFAAFQPLVRRLIRQYGEDAEARQDLVGEIYCRFCSLLDAYDPQRGVPLRAYLVRTLAASVYTYSRSQWRHRQREMPLESEAALEPSSEPDPASELGRQMAMEELLNGLPAAIAGLPLRQRQVVIWRYYESRSFEEIAEALHIRPATARSLLRHGLNNLRRRIAPPEPARD